MQTTVEAIADLCSARAIVANLTVAPDVGSKMEELIMILIDKAKEEAK